MIDKEHQVISIIIIKNLVYIFMFFSFISYHINHTNIFYYYTKAILPYDFYHTFRNFYFYRAFIISLISVNVISIFILLILIKVKFNILNIFFRFCI